MMIIHDLLSEIQASANSKQYYVALFSALAVPDIAGAIDSDNGRACSQKYKAWFDNHAAARFKAFGVQLLTGEECWQYRCVMLHQGRAHDTKSRYARTLFMTAKQSNTANCGAFTVDGGKTLCLDIEKFCAHIVEAGWEWLEQVENTELFKRNAAEFAELFTLDFRP